MHYFNNDGDDMVYCPATRSWENTTRYSEPTEEECWGCSEDIHPKQAHKVTLDGVYYLHGVEAE